MTAHYLPESPRVLDLGCGCGKLARFFCLNPGLTYVGIDLFAPSIRWCRRAFAPFSDRFDFIHFDGQSDIYNPTGKIKSSEYVLPLEDSEMDMTICASLFTHLFEADARHYLEEIARITSPAARRSSRSTTRPRAASTAAMMCGLMWTRPISARCAPRRACRWPKRSA